MASAKRECHAESEEDWDPHEPLKILQAWATGREDTESIDWMGKAKAMVKGISKQHHF